MQNVVVIGAGLTGLCVARGRKQLGDRVTVVEAAERLGGQLLTERTDGFLLEHGAEGFVARSRALERLAEELGLSQELVDQQVLTSYALEKGALVLLVPGEAASRLGFQVAAGNLGQGIRSFRHGMGELVGKLEQALKPEVTIRNKTRATGLSRKNGGWQIALDPGEALEADAVVLCTTAADAARLLKGSLEPVARLLGRSATVSSVTVTLAHRTSALGHPLDASGFIVSEEEAPEGLRACAFSSEKLPGRAPPGYSLLRLFFRPQREDLDLNDAAWTERAVRCLRQAMPVDGPPERAWVSRWPDALPIHGPEHAERIGHADAALAPHRILLAGSAFHGAGIDAAVRSAERAVARLSAFSD